MQNIAWNILINIYDNYGPDMVISVINYMNNETQKYENGKGPKPSLEYAVSLCIDNAIKAHTEYHYSMVLLSNYTPSYCIFPSVERLRIQRIYIAIFRTRNIFCKLACQ